MSGYGFKDENIYYELKAENILSKVREETLWRYYIGFDYELKKDYISPLRPKEDRPSFNLYEDSRRRIKFKDFGGGGIHGDIFDFLQKRDGLTYYETMVRVNVDFGLRLGNPHEQSYKGFKPMGVRIMAELGKFEEKFPAQVAPLINAHTKAYTESDYNYWMQYGITKDTLKLYDVHCIGRIRIKKGDAYWYEVYQYSADNPCYGYYFPKSKHIKCYFPLASSSQIRFIGNANNYEDIQGYYQCNVKRDKANKLLILTKSMKDCMCLREMGYEAMSIHGEGQYFYKDFIRHIKKYYPKIISMYDRDRTGVKGALYLWRTYGISAVLTPKSLAKQGIKDISDMYRALGKERTEEYMKGLSDIYVANNATLKDQ